MFGLINLGWIRQLIFEKTKKQSTYFILGLLLFGIFYTYNTSCRQLVTH